ncbi:MAG TPA: SDR family oxidoreductase [Vicinamibacterales bacterium]|jgi:3-oxoacyl-[acyl-carrier protein] reductase
MSTGRRILITGASRGLGLAMVRHHLDRGDIVLGCARSGTEVTHPGYSHLQHDVCKESEVDALFKEVRARGGLDVLINNAGVAGMNAVALTTADAARRIIDVNVLGTFLCSRAAIRLLRASPAGRIVNVTSVAVPLRLEGEAMYAAAKSAVETFTRIIAREVAPLGITCNAVGPSPVRTRLTESVPKEKIEELLGRQAIPRWGEPADVINVVDFFLRPESALVTGQVVYLGGVG